MKVTPSELLNKDTTIESFEKAVKKNIEHLSLSAEDMIALGEKYFQLYPDREQGRNMNEVHFGYDLVRCCIVEKSLMTIDKKKFNTYREALLGKSDALETFNYLIDEWGKESIMDDYNTINQSLNDLKHSIDEIPKGMIKERFVGGISSMFNTLYLLKMVIR